MLSVDSRNIIKARKVYHEQYQLKLYETELRTDNRILSIRVRYAETGSPDLVWLPVLHPSLCPHRAGPAPPGRPRRQCRRGTTRAGPQSGGPVRSTPERTSPAASDNHHDDTGTEPNLLIRLSTSNPGWRFFRCSLEWKHFSFGQVEERTKLTT